MKRKLCYDLFMPEKAFLILFSCKGENCRKEEIVVHQSWKDHKRKAVTFSYDDGVVHDVRLVELLNQYHLKCTFNLNSEVLGYCFFLKDENHRIAHYRVRPEHVRELYEGHEVAVHTLTHPNLTQLDEAEIIRQVEEDRKNLEDLVGYDVVGMAYPCGGVNNDDRVASIIRQHTKIKYCRTTTCTGSFDIQEDLYKFNPTAYHIADWDQLMELGRKFVEMQPDSPQIFYVWGHSYEMDLDSSYWAKLEEFFKLISNHDDIFYGTNAEILLG